MSRAAAGGNSTLYPGRLWPPYHQLFQIPNQPSAANSFARSRWAARSSLRGATARTRRRSPPRSTSAAEPLGHAVRSEPSLGEVDGSYSSRKAATRSTTSLAVEPRPVTGVGDPLDPRSRKVGGVRVGERRRVPGVALAPDDQRRRRSIVSGVAGRRRPARGYSRTGRAAGSPRCVPWSNWSHTSAPARRATRPRGRTRPQRPREHPSRDRPHQPLADRRRAPRSRQPRPLEPAEERRRVDRARAARTRSGWRWASARPTAAPQSCATSLTAST